MLCGIQMQSLRWYFWPISSYLVNVYNLVKFKLHIIPRNILKFYDRQPQNFSRCQYFTTSVSPGFWWFKGCLEDKVPYKVILWRRAPMRLCLRSGLRSQFCHIWSYLVINVFGHILLVLSHVSLERCLTKNCY